jgi:hypothetical protein
MRTTDVERRQQGWPGNARAASTAVDRLAPALRAAGVEVSRRKVRGAPQIFLAPALEEDVAKLEEGVANSGEGVARNGFATPPKPPEHAGEGGRV